MAVPRVFLHLGMHKTGTTAVQRYFHQNGERLRRAGLAYAPLPGANHSFAVNAIFRPPAEVERWLAKVNQRALLQSRDELRAGLAAFVSSAVAEGRDVVISGEEIPAIGEAGLRDLRDLCAANRASVTALALVRPPLSFARSAAQQVLKSGATLERMVGEARRLPRYRTRFEGSLAVFGTEGVRFGLFHRDALVDGDVLPTLLALMGGDRAALAGERAPRRNEAVSLPGAKLLNLLNEAVRSGRLSPDCPAPIVERLGPVVERLTGGVDGVRSEVRAVDGLLKAILAIPGPPFVLPREVAQYVGQATDDAAWMGERLGLDLKAFDDAVGPDTPSLAQMRRFDPGEVETILTALAAYEGPALTAAEVAARKTRRSEAHVRRSLAQLAGAAPSPRKAGRGGVWGAFARLWRRLRRRRA